ncbi:MAG TPA: response regulator transcription factor [Rugosimonospora sp.]|nr:response regulator transcription factor [Rugosimonospora sp.]
MTIRLVAVDEHVLLRMGLARILAGSPDIVMVGEAGSHAEALEVVPALRPDVVTLGLNLPDTDGIAAGQALRERLPDLGVVLLTVVVADAPVLRAMDAGLSAYVSKSATVPEVLAAIRHAAAAPHGFTAPGLAGVLRRVGQQPSLLSQRELEVLALMRDGSTLPMIATQLEVSLATVKTYVARLYTKLKVNNRAQALIAATNLGLLAADAA